MPPTAQLTTRPALEEALAHAVAAARRSGTAVALAYADVDDFRRVNDSLGTELGEELLARVSARLRSAVRPGDLVAREGDERFLVLVRGLPVDARAHAEAVGQRFAEVVRSHGIEAGRFVLEITESAWSLEASRLLPVLGELRAAGFALAIDDFGAGYSSLWRLRELPVQIIKVDRAFLGGVPEDPQGTAVYSAILRLAGAFGWDVVAEGVERAEHAEFLQRSGCRIGQGFHWSRPVPAEEMTALLLARIAPERRR